MVGVESSCYSSFNFFMRPRDKSTVTFLYTLKVAPLLLRGESITEKE